MIILGENFNKNHYFYLWVQLDVRSDGAIMQWLNWSVIICHSTRIFTLVQFQLSQRFELKQLEKSCKLESLPPAHGPMNMRKVIRNCHAISKRTPLTGFWWKWQMFAGYSPFYIIDDTCFQQMMMIVENYTFFLTWDSVTSRCWFNMIHVTVSSQAGKGKEPG